MSKTRILFHVVMFLPLGLVLLLADLYDFSTMSGAFLGVAVYALGALVLRPIFTGDSNGFPDHSRISANLEELADHPRGVTVRAELIRQILKQIGEAFHTDAYFLETGDQVRQYWIEPNGEARFERPGAAARRYRGFASALPEEGYALPEGGLGPGKQFYRPRGLRGDYFLPLNVQNQNNGVLALRRATGFSRSQRLVLKHMARALALQLDTTELQARVRDREDESRRREKHLTRMENMTRSLLNHITREIARPIDEIENNAARLSTNRPDSGNTTMRIQKLHLLAHQVSALLEDSLLLVELESGTYHLQVEEHPAQEILRESLLEAKMKLPDSVVEIELDIDEKATVQADRYLLGSVFYRLFRTVRLIPRRCTLHVVTEHDDPLRLMAYLELHEDGGPGKPNHLNQLYPYLETFTRALYKSVRLMGSRLEFPGSLDQILRIRFPDSSPIELDADDEAEHA